MNRYDWKALFTQPSTYAGIGMFSMMFGHNIAPDVLANAATGMAALLAVFIPEKGAK